MVAGQGRFLFPPGRFGRVAGQVETDLVILDVIDPADRDQVVLKTSAHVELGQLDVGPRNMIDLADVFAVRPDDHHVFLDFRDVDHWTLLLDGSPARTRETGWKFQLEFKKGPAMLKVYHAPQTRSSRLIWLLEELGADYEIRYVTIQRMDGSGAPDPANPHPLKQVPAIEHDGVVITESAIIFGYLCDLYPGTAMAPAVGAAGRAQFAAWIGLYAGVLEPVITARFRSAEGLTATQAAAYDQLTATLTGALAHGDYLMGDAFSAADILFGSLLMFFRTALPESSVLDGWVARLSARPALARARAKDAPGA